MKNEIAICNRALAYLGLASISSFEQHSREAELLQGIYPTLRDELLESFDFSFATKIERLAHLENKAITDKHYVYQLPMYCLRVREVFTQEEYLFANARTIWSVSPELIVEMTVQISDMSVCSSLFIEALACRIASATAVPLTGNTTLSTEYYKRYLITFEEAQRIDQIPKEDIAVERDWILARKI
ncbi:MAG: hypothetical protein K2M30_00480 [Desulfovibrionaceae bacterium]|nr:hypothetical protein [Desulfovibrionaceae bacterium]